MYVIRRFRENQSKRKRRHSWGWYRWGRSEPLPKPSSYPTFVVHAAVKPLMRQTMRSVNRNR